MAQTLTSFDKRNQVRYESIHDVLDEHWRWFMEAAAPEDGDLILDCGCGYGSCSKELLERQPNSTFVIDLVDESAIQLERAKSELPTIITQESLKDKPSARSVLNYIHASVGSNWPSTRQYEKIFLKMVLHEVPKEEQATFLDCLYRLLKPGGVLIVWDLALGNSVAPFFRDVVGEKDRLLNFETFLNRRHFLTADEFLALVKKSLFETAETVHLFDQNFYSERRIDCEFKGDTDLYLQWLDFISKRILSLGNPERDLLQLEHHSANGGPARFKFVVQRAIWRLRKPDCHSIFNTVSVANECVSHLAPSSAREELPGDIQMTVRKGINVLGQHNFLVSHKGLIRVTTFKLIEKGKRELSQDGTDYVYSFDQALPTVKESFIVPLINAYYGHMAYIYHRKNTANGQHDQTLTDYLIAQGKKFANVSWLRIRVLHTSNKPTQTQIDVTLCRGADTIIHDVLLVSNYDAIKQSLIEAYPPPCDCLSFDELTGHATRIQCSPNSASIDATAKRRVAGMKVQPLADANHIWKHNRLPTGFPTNALVGFAVFLERAGLAYGCYILPPTPLDSEEGGRSNPATVFFSSDRILTHNQEQVLFAFTSKMWVEIRGLELLSASHSFLNVAYREEVLNRSSEKAFFVSKIILPLMCNAEIEIYAKSLISHQGQHQKSIFNEWAANQPRAFKPAHLEDLLQYLLLEREGISAGELLTIHGIKHDLQGFLNKPQADLDNKDLISRIGRALQKARTGGALFGAAARLLESAKHDCEEFTLTASAQSKCKKVDTDLNHLEGRSRQPIKDLCVENQKGSVTKCPCKHPSLDANNLPNFRFRISELQAAVFALRDNAEKHNSPAYELRYEEAPSFCKIVWLERVSTQWSLPLFNEQLLKSAKDKGIHRGLPRVLTFGLECGATKIQILIGQTWHTIWPIGNVSEQSDSTEKEFNYGFRFIL